ncbi:MAG TPA: PaaI family thioesterase [Lysobacter sp.]
MSNIHDHYARLQRLHDMASFNRWYGASIRIGEGYANVRIPVRPMLLDAMQSVHSSVFARALTDAALFAANSLVTDAVLRTVSFTTHYLLPLDAGMLYAEGHVAEQSGRLFMAEAQLLNGSGELLATGSGVFTRSEHALTAIDTGPAPSDACHEQQRA